MPSEQIIVTVPEQLPVDDAIDTAAKLLSTTNSVSTDVAESGPLVLVTDMIYVAFWPWATFPAGPTRPTPTSAV